MDEEIITVELSIRDRQLLRYALAFYLRLGMYQYDEMKQLVLKLGIPVIEDDKKVESNG